MTETTTKIFFSPPLTPELCSAIKLLAPHLDFESTESDRIEFEDDYNAACWSEWSVLGHLMRSLTNHGRVLEIGPGLGRSLIFFSEMLDWDGDEVDAYEGDGTTTRYTIGGERGEDSWCGNIALLQKMLSFNNVFGVSVFDAATVHLADLPGPYELVYSIYSVGFHWAIEHFIDDILQILSPTGTGLFMVPHGYSHNDVSALLRATPGLQGASLLSWPDHDVNELRPRILVIRRKP